MKKWTVMLIPQDRAGTHTLTLTNLHFGVLISFLVCLTFCAAFFYARHQSVSLRLEELREANRALELENARQMQLTPPPGLSEEQMREAETRLRAEYEANLAAINAKLSELYAIESKARDITGLAPRSKKNVPVRADGGGKGGPSSVPVVLASTRVDERLRPPQVIYGMSSPSADLILQEILVRTQSFKELLNDMQASIDRIERVPSGWPLVRGMGRISSSFGYRRDPINFRVCRHMGTDISAPVGTKVRATAKGVVRFAARDGEWGNIVRISHEGGYETWYAHLSRMTVRPGQTVGRNDIIGSVGATGRTTGSHLHFEVHLNGVPKDPEKYLD